MARYYFDIRENEDFTPDDEGLELCKKRPPAH